MASAIDPTKPEDGIPASKAELRSNLETVKTELEHGGFAEGLVPVRYGPPASDRVKDHLAAIDSALDGLGGVASFVGLSDTPTAYSAQASKFIKVKADESGLEFATAPGGSGGLTGWTDVRADHGAFGDGVSDDTAALQAALSSGASVIYLPAGTYKVTSHLSVTPGTTIIGAGAHAVTIDGSGCGTTDTTGILDCKGSTTALPALASAMTAGGDQVTFASSVASLLEHGDVVRFRDPAPGSFAGSSSNERDGWYAIVHSAEGSVLYPSTPVLRTLPAARTGSAVGAIEAVRLDRRGVGLRGFRLIGQGIGLGTASGSSNGIGIYLKDLRGVVIDDVIIQAAVSAALELHNCARVQVTNSQFTILTGTWNNAGAYGFWVRGGAYIFASNCLMISGRHAVDISTSDAPAHTVRITNSLIAAPGSGLFQAPDSTAIWALDWHEGTFDTAVTNSEIQGGVFLRGMAMTVEGCTIYRGDRDGGQVSGSAVGTWKLGPALDLRMINNKIIHRGDFWQGDGQILEINGSDLNIDAGEPGALEFVGNSIFMLTNTTDALIKIQDTVSRSPATGVVNISNNHVVHSACSTSQPFLSVSVTSFERLTVLGNVLPANVTLGVTAGTGFDQFAALNTVAGRLEVAGLPTANPGGTGRLWSDAGTLKVT